MRGHRVRLGVLALGLATGMPTAQAETITADTRHDAPDHTLPEGPSPWVLGANFDELTGLNRFLCGPAPWNVDGIKSERRLLTRRGRT